MTAIALKKEKGFIHMASDGREVAESGVILTDNSKKIYEEDRYIFAGGGDARQLSLFNDYLLNNIDSLYIVGGPRVEDLICNFLHSREQEELKIDIILILKEYWDIYRDLDNVLDLIDSDCYAIGSGSQFCIGALEAGALVGRAIEIACKHHSHCGGIIDSYSWRIK